MSVELKPCPFCGGMAYVMETSTGTHEKASVAISFKIKCKRCDATAPKAYGFLAINLRENGELNVWKNDLPIAIEAWNRRAEPPKEDA